MLVKDEERKEERDTLPRQQEKMIIIEANQPTWLILAASGKARHMQGHEQQLSGRAAATAAGGRMLFIAKEYDQTAWVKRHHKCTSNAKT